MSIASAEATADRRRGRRAQARPMRVVPVKIHRTISVDHAVDQQILEHAQRVGNTYSGLVEDTMRVALAPAITAAEEHADADSS